MIYVDHNNIICTGEKQQGGKLYIRSFFGIPYSAEDHTVLLVEKNGIEMKQWKDVWPWKVVMVRGAHLDIEESVQKWYSRLWFDILYKMDEETGEALNTARVDSVVSLVANSYFWTSRKALVVPTYDMQALQIYIVSFLFGVALAHGKWMVKNNVLFPVKISLPLTSSLLWQRTFFETTLKDILVQKGIVHTLSINHNGTYDMVHITLHDHRVLSRFAQRLNPIVNITKISTFDSAQRGFAMLQAYVQASGDQMPLWSAEELLLIQAD